MRRRIRQIARGKFEYRKPDIVFPNEAIQLQVYEDEECNGEFIIDCHNDVMVRGVVYSSHPRMECLTPQFEGTPAKIRYRFQSKGLCVGEEVTGCFEIVCNQRKYSLSFCVQIKERFLEASTGPLTSLTDFTILAQSNWKEAFSLFYHKSFSNLIKNKDSKEMLLYRGISSAKPSDRNLEEFLVATKQKEKISISISVDEIKHLSLAETIKESIEIKKSNWGYLDLKISCDQALITLGKNEISTNDFMGSSYLLEYWVEFDQLHAGNNYAVISIDSAYEHKEIKILVTKQRTASEDERTKRRKFEMDIKECKVGIVELYQAYRLKRIVTGVWANETISIFDHLRSMCPNEWIYVLMKAQALIINRQRQEAEWLLDEFKKEWLDKKDPLWGYYLYLLTLLEREPVYVDRMTKEIEQIFRENPDSVLLFWVLSFLQEEYYNNNGRKLKAIEYWVMKGCNSPYLYLEAYYLIWQDPYLLNKLGPFEMRILRWAAKNHAITKEIAATIFKLAETSRDFKLPMYELLCAAYEVEKKPGDIGLLCGYLIKGQQYDKKYHHWYEKGIELELRITGLYEAYLLSMDDRELLKVPKIVQMYFRYDSSLPYKKMAVLYNNIISSRDTNKDLYQNYRRTMGIFAMEQMEQGHMDDNLSIVYEDMLDLGMLNEELAHHLAHLLFMHKLTVFDSHMVRALVYHKEISEPQIVPIVEHSAYIALPTRDYVIVLEDEKGRRYSGSIPIEVSPLMNRNKYFELCLKLAPNELAYLVAYFADKTSYLALEKTDEAYFEGILYASNVSDTYRSYFLDMLLNYYRTKQDQSIVIEFLNKVDISAVSVSVRRRLLDLMVENQMYEKVYDYLSFYGIDQISSASVVALSNYMIKQYENEEDEFLLSLVSFGFLKGKYNDAMIGYLCNYWNSSIENLLMLWKSAMDFDIDSFELEERILVSGIYADYDITSLEDIFAHYYENGGRELVVLSYLSYASYAYFIHKINVSDFVFELLEARFLYRLELNDVCKLALLKHIAYCGHRTESQFTVSDELLSEFTCRNMCFSFYQKLDRRLILKYHLYDKVFLEYKANPEAHVVLHYSTDEDGDNFITEDMNDVFGGIFVKTFTMFFGEMIQYYISEEFDGNVEVKESNRVMNHNLYGENDVSRYNLLNQMLISQTLQDDLSLMHNMKQYAGYSEVTNQLFKIL